jgi:hypothetical protein
MKAPILRSNRASHVVDGVWHAHITVDERHLRRPMHPFLARIIKVCLASQWGAIIVDGYFKSFHSTCEKTLY